MKWGFGRKTTHGKKAIPPARIRYVREELRTQVPIAASAWDASADGQFLLAIVGESNYQANLRKARETQARKERGRYLITMRVSCEPTNRFDRNAVRVTTLTGQVVGYLQRGDAEVYCAALAAIGGSVTCNAILLGGEPAKPSIGVWLDLLAPGELTPPR